MYATKQSVLTRKRNELPELLEVGADVDYVKTKYLSLIKHLKTSMELMSCTPRVLLMSAVLRKVMCHVFDWNGLRFGMAHKCACSKCIGRWPKTPQLTS